MPAKSRAPRIDATIIDFSPETVRLKSTVDSSIAVVLTGVAGFYLLVSSALQWLLNVKLMPVPEGLIPLIGLFFVLISWIIRRQSWEITFDGDTRMIYGLPGTRGGIPYRDVQAILMSVKPGRNTWSLELELKNSSVLMIVKAYPLDLGLSLGNHLSFILARPFVVPNTLPQPKLETVNWVLPYQMPTGRYPVEWLVLAAGLAALIAMLTSVINVQNLDLFSIYLLPRWLFIAVFVFPGSILASDVQQQYGVTSGMKVSILISVGIVLLSWVAMIWPELALTALIPGIFMGLLVLASATKRRQHWGIWVTVGVILVFGIVVAFKSVSALYAIRHLDPGVVEKIEISAPGKMFGYGRKKIIIDKPEIIRTLVYSIRDAELKLSEFDQTTDDLFFEFIRPFGTNLILKIHEEKVPMGSAAAAGIEGSILGKKVTWANLRSPVLDFLLLELSDKDQFWPPGSE